MEDIKETKPEECLTRPVLEKLAREKFGITDKDAIDAFVNEFVFTILLN